MEARVRSPSIATATTRLNSSNCFAKNTGSERYSCSAIAGVQLLVFPSLPSAPICSTPISGCQYIDPQASERASYAWTLEQARKDNNAQAVKELEALQPYPGNFAIEKIDGERKWVVHYGGLFYRHQDGDFYFHLARISPEYTPADRQAWGDGSAYTVKIVMPQLAVVSFARLDRSDCPVFMFEGRHDEVVPSMITAAWLDKLKAPTKAIVWFENSAHMMMIEEPGQVLAALLRFVRPCGNPGEKRHAMNR